MLHFGYVFNYDTNEADERADLPIPDSCNSITDRMLKFGIFSKRPDQLTVNVYEKGNGIPSHVDTHSSFGDTIVSISLLSGTPFSDYSSF